MGGWDFCLMMCNGVASHDGFTVNLLKSYFIWRRMNNTRRQKRNENHSFIGHCVDVNNAKMQQ